MTTITKVQAPTSDARGGCEKEYATNLTGIGHDVPRVNWLKSTDERDMAPIWENLPQDMVESILAKVPIPDLFRARAISTSMNNVVGDHILHGGESGFMRITGREEVDRVRGLMIIQHSRCRELSFNVDEPIAFNPCTQGWHKLPKISSYLPLRALSTHVIVGGGGLLCIGDLISPGRVPMPNKSLYICNPLTKQWRKLPYPPCRLPYFSGNRGSILTADKATNSYRIVFLLRRAVNKTCSLVYSSKTESWRLTEHCNQLDNIRIISIVADDDENHGSSSSATRGPLRILVENCLTGRLGILGYDVEKASWTQQVAYIDAVEPQLRLYPSMCHLRSVGTLLLTRVMMCTYLVLPWSCSGKKGKPCTWSVVILKLVLQDEASKTSIKTEKVTEMMNIEATTDDDRRLLRPWFSWKANGRHFISMIHRHKGFMLTYDILSGVWSSCRIGCLDQIVAEAIPYQACWAQV